MKRQTIWKMRLLTALLAVFVLAPVWAQNSGRIISGKVVDESGEPLAGAIVMINGDCAYCQYDRFQDGIGGRGSRAEH